MKQFLIGSYAPEGEPSIFGVELDEEKQKLRLLWEDGQVQNPSFLYLHPNCHVLYAVEERVPNGGLAVMIKTEEGYICYNCYSDKKNPPKQKQHHDNEEARIQSEFFSKVPLFFPNLPDRLLFAVPNGGSRHKIEAANMKRQGVKRGVADVILQIPKKGYASLCLEFKTSTGKQSAEQKEYQRQVEMAGSKYVIVRSVEQAIQVMQQYLL